MSGTDATGSSQSASQLRKLFFAALLLAITIALYFATRDDNDQNDEVSGSGGQNSGQRNLEGG